MLDHLPLPWNELQCLSHVLADLAQSAVTTAWAGRRRRIDDALARQMRRKRTACRPAPFERWNRDRLGCRQLRRGLGLPRILFQVGKLQFELIEQRAALRGWPKLFVPQLLIVSLSSRSAMSAPGLRLPQPSGLRAPHAALPSE